MIDKVKARIAGVKTWVWEQLVLGVLVVGAVWAQLAELPDRVTDPRDVKTIALAVLTGFMVLAGQKVRSTADRQREANSAGGVENAPLACARAQEAYGVIFQCLSLTASVATAYTRWQWAIALYVALYPFWRRLYRARIRPLPVPVRYTLDVQFDDPAIGGIHPNLRCADQDEKTLVSPRADDERSARITIIRVGHQHDVCMEIADWIPAGDGNVLVVGDDDDVADALCRQVLRETSRKIVNACVFGGVASGETYDVVVIVCDATTNWTAAHTSWLRSGDCLGRLKKGGAALFIWRSATKLPPADVRLLGDYLDLRKSA